MTKKVLLLFALLLAVQPAISSDACSVTEAGESACSVATMDSSFPLVPVGDFEQRSEEHICILFFYTDNCQDCQATIPFMQQVEEEYGDKIEVHYLSLVRNIRNYNLYNQYCAIQNIPLNERKVPLVVLQDTLLIGEKSVKASVTTEIDDLLKLDEWFCPLPAGLSCSALEEGGGGDPVIPDLPSKINTSLIIISGLVDGINPCAFAVLIFFVGYLLTISESKRRMLKAGVAYVASVYVTYFLAGLGFMSLLHVSGFSDLVYKLAAGVAILAGLINIKDFFWYGKGISLKIPASGKNRIESLVKRANIPAAIMLGFFVSMFELPCTGGIYLAILALLTSSTTSVVGASYLLLYNLMFVLPLIIILLLAVYGINVEKLKSWKDSKKKFMRLFMGLLLLFLGLAMLLNLF